MRVNERIELKPKLEVEKDIKYKVEVIKNSIVNITNTVGHLLGLYYLVSWKNYLKDESI